MSKFKSFIAASVAVGVAMFILAMPGKAGEVDFANPAFAPAGGLTSIPIGAATFCKANRADCAINRNVVEAMPLDEKRWAQLVDTNNLVNAAVVPVTDIDYYRQNEVWAYPTDGYGDCEDFALAKRKALIADGWNPSTLLITVVRQQDGDGHAVLMVRTDRGDLVLDNQDGRILVWNQTPYQYLKRQSQADAGRWVDLIDDRAGLMVASAR
jgi:predicted transglutaminase-like cysteine proteinase